MSGGRATFLAERPAARIVKLCLMAQMAELPPRQLCLGARHSFSLALRPRRLDVGGGSSAAHNPSESNYDWFDGT